MLLVSCSGDGQEFNNSLSTIKLSNWQYRYEESPTEAGEPVWAKDSLNSPGWKDVPAIKDSANKEADCTLWLRTVLPDTALQNPVLYLGYIKRAIQVYIDGVLIYEYGRFIPDNKSVQNGHAVHLIPLPDNFQSKIIALRISSSYDNIVSHKIPILGETTSIIRNLFYKNLDELVISSVYICGGIILLITFLFYRTEKLFLGVAVFLLTLGMWTGVNSQFLQLMFGHPYLFFFIDNITLFSFAIGPFYIIEKLIDTKFRKIIRRIWQINVVYSVVATIAEFITGSSFVFLFPYYLVVFFLVCIFAMGILIHSRRRGNFQARLIIIGFASSLFFGILEILYYSEAVTYSPGFVHIGTGILVVMLALSMIYEYKSTREQKEVAQQEALVAVNREKETRKKYTHKLLTIQEEQCKRISQELHDSVGQDLLVVKNLMSFGKKNKINLVENDKYFDSILSSTSSAIDEIRDISRTLHPAYLENLGLTQAIKSMIERIGKSTDINFTYRIDNIDGVLEQETEIHLFRIVQESFNNIIKHSEADSVTTDLFKDSDTITLSIKDNGKGFDADNVSEYSGGMGLNGITERANLLNGKLKINSGPDEGTEILLEIKI